MLSILQRELFDLMKDQLTSGGLGEYVEGVDSSNIDAFLAELEKDVSTMNASELRHNIKVWKEDL